MKIAVLDTGLNGATLGEERAFLPELLNGLAAGGSEVHLITKGAPDEIFLTALKETNVNLHTNLWKPDGFVEETAPVLAGWLNELNPDVYLIWASADVGWVVLPMLDSAIANLSVGHADSEVFYLPARHYRPFLTRLIGVSPEICIGYVLSSVIEKEKVEWIPYGEQADGEDIGKITKHFESCFEKAIEEAQHTPRETYADYPLPPSYQSRLPMWLRRLKEKVLN